MASHSRNISLVSAGSTSPAADLQGEGSDMLGFSWKSWFDSRSGRMVLISVILALLAVGITALVNRLTTPSAGKLSEWGWLDLLMPVADAMLVVSVTIFLTELGPFRSYVEERLQGLKQILDRPVFDRLTDSSYLRQNFQPELILALRKAATCASLPNIQEIPGFYSLIEDSILPLAGKPLWRKDLHLFLNHEVQTVNNQTLLRQENRISSVYVNTANTEESLVVPLKRTYKKLHGIQDEQLCTEGWGRSAALRGYRETGQNRT